jgi:arylsulfatase A-like enzyme
VRLSELQSVLVDASAELGLNELERHPDANSWPELPFELAGVVADGLVSHVDVLPTLLELAGGEVPSFVQGTSFAGVLRGGPGPRRTEVFAEKNFHDVYDAIRGLRAGQRIVVVARPARW